MGEIWRYSVPVDDEWHALHLSGAILHVDSRCDHVVEVWALSAGGPKVTREFRVFSTGHPLPDGVVHCGTALDGPFVWHLMERRGSDG